MTRHEYLPDLVETMRPQDRAFFSTLLSRRTALKMAAAGATGIAASSALGFPHAAARQTPSAVMQNGELPEDAAPLEEQVLRFASDGTVAKAFDFYETVYERAGISTVFSVPLVRLNRNFEIIPGTATEWSSNDEGTVWTFTIQEGVMWSDDTPLTAADFVRTFQYSADPEHAWDFAWFWDGNIVNYTEALAGDVPLDEIGVRQGANEYEVVFETVEPAPYMPAKLLYSAPLSAKALDEHGPLYNANPDTCVTCGPFKLEEFSRDQQVVVTRNEKYTGSLQIPIQKIINKFAAANTHFTIFEAGETDYMENPAPAELQLAQANPDMADRIFQGVGDFGCFYFFFDVEKEPFDKLEVRQAFSHVVDREAMAQQIWGPAGIPAPSFLAPGFPASNTEELASIQNFDPDTAKQLLADAGYPDGEGFPDLVLQVRGGGSPIEDASCEAYASMLKEHLNINVEIQTMDRQAFYAAMNAKPTEVLFGWVSYGQDYFDPSNMLGVWLSGGRHPWSNEEYDKLVNEATSLIGDDEARLQMFQDAERILVEDVPAVFTYFSTPIQLIKPYLTGPALEADSSGITAIHWPGWELASTVLEELYVSADAPTGRD
jgi:ABC-type transport system substrate-binding protein